MILVFQNALPVVLVHRNTSRSNGNQGHVQKWYQEKGPVSGKSLATHINNCQPTSIAKPITADKLA